MEMMKIFIFNLKKYRKKRQLSQMKLAEMLETSTSYIGEIEINRKIPSLNMVERIANALEIEPFKLFMDEDNRNIGKSSLAEDYLKCLSHKEMEDLLRQFINLVCKNLEQCPLKDNKLQSGESEV